MESVDARASRIGAGQLGLATTRQLRAEGIHRDTIRRRLRSGRWRERLPGVVDLGTHEPDWWRSTQALLLAAGEGAVLSHGTAAHLHRLPDARRPSSPDVLVRRGRHASVGGVRLHTTVLLAPTEVVRVDGWPVTAGGRTVVDNAPKRSDDWLQLSIGQLLRRGATTLTDVVESAAARQGAVGTGRVIRACAGLPPDLDRTESPLEVRGVIEFARLGLPSPVLQHVVELEGRHYRFDAAWPRIRLAAEFDGKAWHDTELRSGADAVKDGCANRAGWEVVRVRDSDVRAPERSPKIRRLRALLL